jgi:uncharacterized UBP type Zn finger protein
VAERPSRAHDQLICSSVTSTRPAIVEFGPYRSRVRAVPASRPAVSIKEMILCQHHAHIKLKALPQSVDGCQECLVAGTKYLHLRICLQCGHVGCCDSSPERHAAGHAGASGHPIIRSLEADEEWSWCYIDQIGMLTPEVIGSTHIPPSPLEQ